MAGERFGPFLLEAIIGEGSTSVIYRAKRGEEVLALKIRRSIAAHGFDSGTADHEFLEEGKLLQRLQHPNIVRVLEVAVISKLATIAFELVEGPSLEAQIEHQGPLAPAKLGPLASAVADALRASQEQGILHRDVKPGNVLLTKDDVPKLVDFGSAGGVIQDASTGQIMICGSPAYMAPEQITAPTTADHRADMYALGATLYHAASGRPPHRYATPKETLRAQIHVQPEPISALAPGLPPELGEVIMRLLEKRPEDRFERWDQVLEHLVRAGRPRAAPRRESSIVRFFQGLRKNK